jgi:hypothetical protein
MIYAYDFIPFYAMAEGNPYLNNLFWVIYDRLATFTQMGACLMSSAERRSPHPGGVPRGQRVRRRRCAAAVSAGERQQLSRWRLAHSNPTSCAQVSKRLVAYIKALLVLSPYGRPSDSSIAAIADAHFNQALASLNVLPDVYFKAYMERKAGEFFKAYGFVAREGEEDDEKAAAAAAAAAAAVATAAEAAAAAAVAAASTPRYSLD